MKINKVVPGIANFEAARERMSTTSFSMSSAQSASIEAYHQKLWQPPNRKTTGDDLGPLQYVNGESLEATLSDPIAIGYLLHFMTRQFCSENLRAWMVIDDYKAEYRTNQQLRSGSDGDAANSKNETNARKIWNQFVGDDSVFEICVRDDERKKVDAILESRGADKSIFDFAQDHAMETIRKDTWPRYLRSQEYKDYCTGSVSYEKGLIEKLLCLPQKCSGPFSLFQLQRYCRRRRNKPESIFEDRTLFSLLRAYEQHMDGHDHCAEGVCLLGLAARHFDKLAEKSAEADETKHFCWFVYFSFLAPGSLFEVPTDPVVLKKVCMNFAKAQGGLFSEIQHGCQGELLKCWKSLCDCDDPCIWRLIFDKALPNDAPRPFSTMLPCADKSSRKATGEGVRIPLLEQPHTLNAEVQTFVHQVGRLVYNIDMERVTAVMLVAASNRAIPRTFADLEHICTRVNVGFDRVPPAGSCASRHLTGLRTQIAGSRLKIEAMMHSKSDGMNLIALEGTGSFSAGGSFAGPSPLVRGEGFAVPWFRIWQFYTRMASQCLGLIIGRSLAITSTIRSAETIPYLVFVQYKERVGMERALIAGILSSGEFSSRYHVVLKRLVNLQDFLRTTFVGHCSPEMLERFNALEASPNTKACEDLRALVIETFMSRAQGDDSGHDSEECCMHAGDWYDWMTKRLSDYHEIERTLCSQMLHQSATASNQPATRPEFNGDGSGLTRWGSFAGDGNGASAVSVGAVIRSKVRFARASRIERATSLAHHEAFSSGFCADESDAPLAAVEKR